MGKIRVLVASEHEIVRTALRHLLKKDAAFAVLRSEVDLGEDLPGTCQALSPDVLLLEVSTGGLSSLRAPACVIRLMPNARIVLLSPNENLHYVRLMVRTGVLGYVLKAAAPSELFQAVKAVHQGRQYLDPRLNGFLNNHPFRSVNLTAGQRSSKQLSLRETEVLRAITLGFTTREISKELNVSEKTVQTYRQRIYEKLEVHTRADLVHYALVHGLVGGF